MDAQFLAGMGARLGVELGDDDAGLGDNAAGWISLTLFISARFRMSPPESGMAWP